MNESTNAGSQWSDDPRMPNDPDDLGRGAFEDTLARRIELATLADSSTVFGLIGQWGSGKTSVIKRVREKLSKDWVVGDFTPWATGDSASMSLEFVNTIANVLGAKTEGETRQRLAQYAGFVSPMLAAIPFVGQGVKDTTEGILNALGNRPPWHEQFESLSKLVQSAGKRVLIVVDDVDRLGGEELLTLLRVVRLLGRFRGVHYLIAYDQQTVEDLLSSSGATGKSSAFMEKIVQYPFEMPPISQAASIRLVNDTIKGLLAETKQQLSEEDLERLAELVTVIAPQVKTPRTLSRFGEQLKTFAAHVIDAELDVPDYVAVTWLRLAAHEIWTLLPAWRAELVSGERRETLIKSIPITADEWEQRISKHDPAADCPSTLQILASIFAGVDSRGLNYYVSHQRALSDETYFGRYMLLALPEDDVSDELLREVLGSLGRDETPPRLAELEKVLDGELDLANLALTRSTTLRRQATETSRALISFLARRLVSRKDDVPGIGAPRNLLRNWIAWEVVLGLRIGAFSAHEVIEWFGEDESFTLILLASRISEFRANKSVLAEGFAAYWQDQLEAEPERFLGEGHKLGAVVDLITFARGDAAAGLLDFLVVDLPSYLNVAKAFIQFQEWVGSGVNYTMAFRAKLFQSAISPEIRLKYKSEVLKRQGSIQYEVEDLPEATATEEIREAFTVDSLAALD
jgi:hypothetical protein